MRETVRFLLGDELVEIASCDPTRTVLDWLRLDRRRTGSKEGCAEGDCGACTVVIGRLDGGRLRYEAINACIRFLPTLDGCHLITVEHLKGADGALHPVQQALVDCQRKGLLRSIGVSNFLPEHLDRISAATSVMPAVNQIQLHPYWPQLDQLAANAARGVRVEAWSPLHKGALLDEPVLAAVAEAHGRTPAQVVLRWHVQLGSVPIPKATAPERQAGNLAVFDFELDPAQVAAISALARPEGGSAQWDPATHQEF